MTGLDLDDLAQFTHDKVFPPTASPDFRVLYVGVDDVHDALAFLLHSCQRSLVMNMFGYDDPDLNAIVMQLVANPDVYVQITLDKSQAGGTHERRLLDADRAAQGGLQAFNSHFAIGQSVTHSISHTKGGVIDGLVAWEGSTNWSADGEGTFVLKGEPGGPRFKAQNNTVTVFNNAYELSHMRDHLDAEHKIAQAQATKSC